MTRRVSSFVLAIIAVIATAIGMTSCRENIAIQSDLTPGVDGIGTDSLIVPDSFFTLNTVHDDSILTSNVGATYSIFHALGWMTGDQLSGRTSANTYLQVVPTATLFSFDATNGAALDSAVLVIPYGGFTWGDTMSRSQQTIHAHLLQDTISNTARYYAFTMKNWMPAEIGNGAYYTGPAGSGVIQDSVKVYLSHSAGTTKTVAPHIRIKLDTAFLSSLKAIVADTSKTSTFAGFLAALKGFYLRADTTAGSNPGKALAYFRLNGLTDNYGEANLLVYAHNNNTDTVVYQLPFNNTYTGAYNRITRNYTDQSVFAPNSTTLMVQNQPGAAIDLLIKNMRNLPLPAGVKLSDIVINKASLIFTEIPSSINTQYTHPPRIYPIGFDASGGKYAILDRYPLTTSDGLSFIDATPRTDSVKNITTYTMNFPREFQQAIVQQKSELHLRINGTQTYPAAYRLLVGNKNHPNYRMVFRVIYSKLK